MHSEDTTTAPTSTSRDARVETYARTNADEGDELVFYNPGESHEWINADISATVSLEAER